MGAKVVKKVFLLVVLVFVTGCDPETLVREKVPGWLQSVMGAQPGEAGAARSNGKVAPATLKILSPADKGLFPVGKPVVFRAEGKLDGGKPAGSEELVWKVKGEKIGNGPGVSKKFPPGKYLAELTMVSPGKKTVSRKVSFTVANLLTGTVIFDGEGLADTKIVLESAEGLDVRSQVVTKNDGSFALEVPEKGAFRLVPGKEGFSFSPPSMDVRYSEHPTAVNFTAAKGGITDIKLTATEDSDTPIERLCPQQTVYVKANIASETPLARLQVILIPTTGDGTNHLVLGEAIDRSEIPDSSNPSAPKAMKVRVSEYILKEEDVRHPFRLQLTAFDENGNAFSAVAKSPVSIDMNACFDKWLADGAALHAEGSLEKAVENYEMLEKYKRLVPDITKAYGQLARGFFNKGLAYVELGTTAEKDEVQRAGHLSKAAHSFGKVLGYRSSDPETVLLAGWVSYLKEEYQRAVEYFSEAINLLPRSADAYQMRGDAYVQTKRFVNLSKAIDDYTRALQVDPNRADLRKRRREALKLELKNSGKPDSQEVDISSIPLAGLEKQLQVKEFIRK